MKANEISQKVKTHYEFISYYEGKRVALTGNTLEDLLQKNAVKIVTWLKDKNFKNVLDGYNHIRKTYNITDSELCTQIFTDMLAYNNSEFDIPYAIEFAKVTADGIIERFSVESDDADIKSLLYQDYLDVMTDEMYYVILDGMGLLGNADIDSLINGTWTYKLNSEEKQIDFELTDLWAGRFRYCINDILRTEDVTEINYFGYTNSKDAICFDTNKGQLYIPIFKNNE